MSIDHAMVLNSFEMLTILKSGQSYARSDYPQDIIEQADESQLFFYFAHEITVLCNKILTLSVVFCSLQNKNTPVPGNKTLRNTRGAVVKWKQETKH